MPAGPPAGAEAHATLEATSPARDAVVASAPPDVSFRFDEAVGAAFGAVRVCDAEGHEVQRAGIVHPGGRASVVAVDLPTELPGGTYTATYRVVSADGHPVSGGLVFRVGAASAQGASVADLLAHRDTGRLTDLAFGIDRGVGDLALALGVGLLIFLVSDFDEYEATAKVQVR